MCTVTFIARKNGYALGMNRDEKLSRVQALPPSNHLLNGRTAIFPSEPSGGTWIGVNDAGLACALINWYSVPARVSRNGGVSRGIVVRSALELDSLNEMEQHFGNLPLEQINPFRLISIFPQKETVIEWRWNLSRLETVQHSWRTNMWISSGFDEAGAQEARGMVFRRAHDGGLQNRRCLRTLHASHDSVPSAYSICMHREGAATVSYTEVVVDRFASHMSYCPGSLCCNNGRRRKMFSVSLNHCRS